MKNTISKIILVLLSVLLLGIYIKSTYKEQKSTITTKDTGCDTIYALSWSFMPDSEDMIDSNARPENDTVWWQDMSKYPPSIMFPGKIYIDLRGGTIEEYRKSQRRIEEYRKSQGNNNG